MSTPNPILEVQDLVTQYGSRRVLDGVSFAVPEGLVTVILGGSGCGKSTLLRHLIGLQRPSAGRILVKGRDLTCMAPTSWWGAQAHGSCSRAGRSSTP
jgi:phospholipid/cholesterol/gamma-HCH transport system ATP-binding protein